MTTEVQVAPDKITQEAHVTAMKTQLTTYWAKRNDQIKKDRRQIALVEPQPVEGVTQITLNEPKVQYDTAVAILSGFQPVLRMPWSTQDETQREMMSKGERFLNGAFRSFNKHQFFSGKESWYYELAYWSCSGWIACFPLYQDGEFSCDFFDPLTVYPQFQRGRTRRVMRLYYVSREEALDLAKTNDWEWTPKPNTKKDSAVEICSLWEQEGKAIFNTVTIADSLVKEKTKEKFIRIPIFVIPVGGTPEGPLGTDDTSHIGRKGENIIAANRRMFEYMDKYVATLIHVAYLVAYPVIIEGTESGKGSLKKGQIKPGTVIPRKLEDVVKALDVAGSAGYEFSQIFGFLGRGIQKAGLPEIVHGGLPFEISGFMGSQLFAAIKYKLNARLIAMTNIISYVATEILRQYRASGGKIELVVEAVGRAGKGESFVEVFTKDNIPESTFVEVTIPLATMIDKAQQIQMARMALNQPQVLSRPTLWEDMLDVQDIALEYERLQDDMMMNLPGVQMIMTLEKLQVKIALLRLSGDKAKAELADRMERYMSYLEQSIPGLGGGSGQGGGAPGMSPGGLPPEFGAGGGLSPDVLNAMGGRPPSGGQPGARTSGAAARGIGGL